MEQSRIAMVTTERGLLCVCSLSCTCACVSSFAVSINHLSVRQRKWTEFLSGAVFAAVTGVTSGINLAWIWLNPVLDKIKGYQCIWFYLYLQYIVYSVSDFTWLTPAWGIVLEQIDQNTFLKFLQCSGITSDTGSQFFFLKEIITVHGVNVCITTEKMSNKHHLSWAGIAGENHWLIWHLMRSWSSQPFGTTGLRAAPEEQAVPSPLRWALARGGESLPGCPNWKQQPIFMGGGGENLTGKKERKWR